MNLLGPVPPPPPSVEGAALSAVPPPLPPPRVRTARQRWTTRGALGAVGLLGLGLFHQFNYSRKVAVWRDAMFVLEEELAPEVLAETGALSRYPWWDVRGLTLSWEWRPRAWFRELWAAARGEPPALCHPTESAGWSRFRLRGELRDAAVEAQAQERAGRGWQLLRLRVAVPETGKEFVVLDRRETLPDNMTRSRA